MSGGLLGQAFVYLLAAVLVVPLVQRLGLGSVLGYLLAGMAIGPFGLGLVGAEGMDVMEFAQLGLVMMLFVVGLDLQPAVLWRLRGPILGLGGLQVVMTTAAFAAAGAMLGAPWQVALVAGMALSLSCTPLALQALTEKGLLRTTGGQSSFSVLLFQDIGVIPMLALVPLLAASMQPDAGAGPSSVAAGSGWIAGLPAWAQAAAVLGAVAGIVLAGRFLVRPMLRAIAASRTREVFTAASLLLIVGTTLLMTQVGLSPALGAFLAGVVLANSEYRHELVSDIEPFKGLLLGLFFIAIGAIIDFGLVASEPVRVVALLGGVLAIKFAVLFGLSRVFGLATDQALLVAFALPQVGEFSFVLLAFAGDAGLLTTAVSGPLVTVAALSMAVSPVLMLLNERLLLPRVGTRTGVEREPDVQAQHAPVLIAGFGSFGSTVGRLLRANRIPATVLDHDSDRVDMLRRMGLDVYYGDATRHDLLATAGAADARLLVIALDSPDKALDLLRTARRHFPHLRVYARAHEWDDAHSLMEAGADMVYREAVDTSVRLGTDLLRALGHRAHQAHRYGQKFLRHEEESMRGLTALRADRGRYMTAARQRVLDLEKLLLADLGAPDASADAGWDPDTLRAEVRARLDVEMEAARSSTR